LITEYEKRPATRIKVKLSNDTDQYAISFLAIYNNVKSHSELLKLYNDYAENVFVVCESEVCDDTVEFLQQFGEIICVESVEVVEPLFTNYDYNKDIDTEFLNFEE
jgi:hypothetical protein